MGGVTVGPWPRWPRFQQQFMREQDRHTQGFGVPGSGTGTGTGNAQFPNGRARPATWERTGRPASRRRWVAWGTHGSQEWRRETSPSATISTSTSTSDQHHTARPGYAFLPAPHILSVHRRFAAVPLTIAPPHDAFGVPRRGRITVASLSRLCPAARAANAIIAARLRLRLRLPRPPPAPAGRPRPV